MNCYIDVKWSATYGSFYSSEACVRRRSEIEARQKAQLRQSSAGGWSKGDTLWGVFIVKTLS